MSQCLTFETAFCKKAQNFVLFGSSDFDQISPACGKHIVIKELQMVFLTSTVSNGNGNMKELERKIKCEKLMFR